MPPAATMPISSEPGSTTRSSSVNTFVVGACAKVAVPGDKPFIEIWVPIVPSVEPMASTRIACSIRSSNCWLTSVVHITPEEEMTAIDDVSYFEPSLLPSSKARINGLAKLSPTMVTAETRWRSTVSSTSCASRLRLVSVITCPPARWGMKRPIHSPVPCISGAHGIEIS